MRFLIPLFAGLAIINAQEDFDRLTFHAAPKPLAEDAKTEDWPRFLGPNDNCTSGETHLLQDFPESGPKLVWEMEKGESFTAPAIVGDRLVYFHNIDDVDIIECLHPETGKRYWEHRYENRYRDRYGYGMGPRAAPVIADGKVYTLAATSHLHCLNLETGEVIWKRDLAGEFDIPQYFFGHGPSPLILGEKVIVPLGSETKDTCVAAFHKDTGELIWETPHEWRASYASPIATELHGKERILYFAGGESRPPFGGLICIDPENGEVDDSFFWRSSTYESVNASTPLVIPNNRVLVSETYSEGAALLEFGESLDMEPVWKAPELKLHWMTPLYIDGHFYAFTGRNEPDAGLDCWDAATGERKWREEFFWKKQIGDRTYGWSFFRGTLLHADDTIYALGEMGTLAILDLSPEGAKIRAQADLFSADQSWTLPAVSKGLLYVVQNRPDMVTGEPPRLLCYDFRKVE